ncbi:MAG TPA: nitroreductase family deazaflavin-dependent oxidoreductase [Thermoleophilaceae bacterium]|jgi:deazaflavin-dependent oxidoreductase (nitroreductase family)
MSLDPALAGESYCYLTTTGRVSGEPREIEIWFALNGPTLYLLAGGRERANWVRNLRAEPRVSVRIGAVTAAAAARVVEDPEEDALARRLVHGKYASGPDDMPGWRDTALPVALDLEA